LLCAQIQIEVAAGTVAIPQQGPRIALPTKGE